MLIHNMGAEMAGLGGVLGTVAGGFLGGPLGATIGGALGGAFDAERGRNQALADQRRNFEFQREMAQMGIQWRVQDAKKAGVHPVYALGAALPSGSPVTVGGDYAQDTGQDVSRVVGAMDPQARRLQDLQLRVLESQIGENDARAAYYLSEAARRSQPGQAPPQPMWIPGVGGSAAYREVGEPGIYQLEPGSSGELPGAFDVVKPKPSEQISARSDTPWTTPGVQPGFDRHRLTKYLEMLLPRNEEGWSEGVESVPVWMYPLVYQANVDAYGPQFWRVAIQELGANSKFARWLSRLDPPQGRSSSSRSWQSPRFDPERVPSGLMP